MSVCMFGIQNCILQIDVRHTTYSNVIPLAKLDNHPPTTNPSANVTNTILAAIGFLTYTNNNPVNKIKY